MHAQNQNTSEAATPKVFETESSVVESVQGISLLVKAPNPISERYTSVISRSTSNSVPLLYKDFASYKGLNPVTLEDDVDALQDLHMVINTDGEWLGEMNKPNREIVLGYRLQGGKGVVMEHPSLGLGKRPSWGTQSLPAHILGMCDRVDEPVYHIEYRKNKKVKVYDRPSITIHNFIYFSAADNLMMFKCGMQFTVGLCTQLDQNRRVLMANKYQKAVYIGLVYTDANGKEYDVKLRVYDVCAVTGALGGYGEACKVAGVPKYEDETKEFLNDYKGGGELEAYKEHTDDFCAYNENDLYNQEIVWGMQKVWSKICSDTGTRDISEELALTHGSNVVKYCLATLERLTDVNGEYIKSLELVNAEKLLEEGKNNKVESFRDAMVMLNRDASSMYLATAKEDTRYYSAAIDGGRCKNELPRRTRIKGAVLDNDIDGCYGNGLMNQIYPLGRATILSFPHNELHKRPSLKEFISNKKVSNKGLKQGFFDDLVAGLWTARISTTAPLSFFQDLITSKIGLKPKTEAEIVESRNTVSDDRDDPDNNDAEIGGKFTLILKEIENGILTSDALQVLLAVATDKERSELLDKIVVNSAVYYPKSQQVDTFKEVLDSVKNEKGYWTSPNPKIGIVDERSHKWCAVDMGTNWVDLLAGLRKSYSKKTAENTFYKLIINCIYGVACSVFFPEFSNVVVANNITGRARVLAWMMAKSCKGQQSITDGAMSDLNNFLYWEKYRPGFNALACLDAPWLLPNNARYNLKSAPLNRQNVGNPDCAEYEIIGGYYELKEREKASEMVQFRIGEETKINQDWDTLKASKSYKIVSTMRQGDEIFDVSAGNTATFDTATWAHMAYFFRDLDIDILCKEGVKIGWDKDNKCVTRKKRIGQFNFEGKDVYTGAAFHSQSNYLAVQVNGSEVIKCRGVKLKAQTFDTPHGVTSLNKNGTVPKQSVLGEWHNMRDMLHRILNDEKLPAYGKQYISVPIKVKEWNKRCKTKGSAISDVGLMPGDSASRSNWLRASSPSMHRYLTIKQYERWTKHAEVLKDVKGYSLEIDYLDTEGMLDYKEAVNAIQSRIEKGEYPTIPGKKNLQTAYENVKHPYYDSANRKYDFEYLGDEDLNDIFY